MTYCGEKKKFFCTQYPPCNKGFKREKNFLYHIAVDYTGEKDTLACDECKNIYKSATSYKAHKKNNQCYIIEEDSEDSPDEEAPQGSQQAEETPME